MRAPIIAHISLADMPPHSELDYDSWARWLCAKLREAGIPANPDGSLDEGTLRRFDDPKSWSVTIYEWWPDGYPTDQ